MKKVLSIVLATMLLVVSLGTMTAAKDYTNYLTVKLSDNTVEQTQLSAFIDGYLFDSGETYTLTVEAKADGVVSGGGHAFVACYSYKAYAPDSYDGLGAWKDCVAVTDGSQDWTETTYEWVADEPTDQVLVNVGFYKAVGTISVAELYVKNAAGEIVWEADFTKPLSEEWKTTVNDAIDYEVVGAKAPEVETEAELVTESAAEPEAVVSPATGDGTITALLVLAAASALLAAARKRTTA